MDQRQCRTRREMPNKQERLSLYLQELDDLAGSVAGQPLNRGCPNCLGDVTEEGDEQVGGGQMRKKQVDGGAPASHPVHASQCRRVGNQCHDEHDRQDDRLYDGKLRQSRHLRVQAGRSGRRRHV